MKKKFNSSQLLKSSEDCNKFSKSVSYETLVGGTATTGRKCVQNQWLSKGSANKPLTAVGTLTSLLCNSAKVKALSFLRLRGASGAQGISTPASCRKAHKRRFIFNPWILRFVGASLRMTIPALAFLLSLNISTSWAVTCTRNGTKLTVTGSGNEEFTGCSDGSHKTATEVTIGTGVTSIGEGAFAGASSLTSITIPKGVTSIGKEAFAGASSLESITIPKGVTSIGAYAFYDASSLTSITIPDSVTSIGKKAFKNTSSLTSITIPEGVTSIGFNAFAEASGLKSIIIPDNINTANWDNQVFYNTPEGANIVCQGGLNTCYEKLAKYFTSETCPQSLKDAGKGNLCNCSGEKCISPSRIKEATSASQCTGNYGWSGAGCSRKNADGSVDCASGFVEWDKQCLSEYPFAKKRWTPAEAAQWLHDGNDNFVVITFKK